MERRKVRKPFHKVISSIHKIDDNELPNLKRRIDIASALVLLLIAGIVFRLWFLQIHKGAYYKKLSENNRIRVENIAAPRGNIIDRKGRLLITSRPSYNILWTKEDAPDPDEVLKKVSSILDIDISQLLDRIRQAAGHPRYMAVRLAEDIGWSNLVRIENHQFELPGISIQAVPTRQYLYGDAASHLMGYLGEINDQELAAHSDEGYQAGDLFGKRGIEKLYEKYLHGEKGYRYLEVDARGFEQKELESQDSLAGNDLVLTLDINLQQAAEKALAGEAGAVVAMEVNTGRVLVMASAPSVPLEAFSGGISQQAWDKLVNNPLHPLLNKCIQGQYPPGSTYKIVTAMAGLMEGVITKNTVLYCPGYLRLGNHTFRCWKHGGHGAIALHRALAESCDVYFYMVGQRLGVDRLASYAKSFGLGEKTGINLEHEKPGLVPTSDWKLHKFQVPWQEGETLPVAIGQGFNLVTPLQACRMITATANGGILYRPQFIERIVSPDGKVIQQFKPIVDGRVKGKRRYFNLIKQGLISAVNDRHGTAGSAKLADITVAGKTGTAQVVHLKSFAGLPDDKIPYKYRDHAWFVCFAPAEAPKIAVAVLVEHGGHGGSTAGPIAKSVLVRYFEHHDP